MKKLVLYLCAIFCLLLALVPAAGAVGGGEGWIQINCNVDVIRAAGGATIRKSWALGHYPEQRDLKLE